MSSIEELSKELSKLDQNKEFSIDDSIRVSEIIGELSDIFARKDISPDALLVEEEDPQDGTNLGQTIAEKLEETKQEVKEEDLKNKVPLV